MEKKLLNMKHIQPCQIFKYVCRENQRAHSNQTKNMINTHYTLIVYHKHEFLPWPFTEK